MKPFGVEDLGSAVSYVLEKSTRSETDKKSMTSELLSGVKMMDVLEASNLKKYNSERVSAVKSETGSVLNVEGEILSRIEKNLLLNYFVKASKEGKRVIVNCAEKVEKKLKEAGFDKFLTINR